VADRTALVKGSLARVTSEIGARLVGEELNATVREEATKTARMQIATACGVGNP
jgi:hypothetical protein